MTVPADCSALVSLLQQGTEMAEPVAFLCAEGASWLSREEALGVVAAIADDAARGRCFRDVYFGGALDELVALVMVPGHDPFVARVALDGAPSWLMPRWADVEPDFEAEPCEEVDLGGL